MATRPHPLQVLLTGAGHSVSTVMDLSMIKLAEDLAYAEAKRMFCRQQLEAYLEKIFDFYAFRRICEAETSAPDNVYESEKILIHGILERVNHYLRMLMHNTKYFFYSDVDERAYFGDIRALIQVIISVRDSNAFHDKSRLALRTYRYKKLQYTCKRRDLVSRSEPWTQFIQPGAPALSSLVGSPAPKVHDGKIPKRFKHLHATTVQTLPPAAFAIVEDYATEYQLMYNHIQEKFQHVPPINVVRRILNPGIAIVDRVGFHLEGNIVVDLVRPFAKLTKRRAELGIESRVKSTIFLGKLARSGRPILYRHRGRFGRVFVWKYTEEVVEEPGSADEPMLSFA